MKYIYLITFLLSQGLLFGQDQVNVFHKSLGIVSHQIANIDSLDYIGTTQLRINLQEGNVEIYQLSDIDSVNHTFALVGNDGAIEITTIGSIWDTSVEVTSDLTSSSVVIQRGYLWGINSSLSLSNNQGQKKDGYRTGSKTTSIVGLLPNTTYYIKPYITTPTDTTYGAVKSFYTLGSPVNLSYLNGIISVYPTNNEEYVYWSTSGWGTESIQTHATSESNGDQNTNQIVSALGSTVSVAKTCNELDAFGYTDWYLPSKNEVELMYIHKDTLNFQWSTPIWTSSETSKDEVWSVDVNTGVSSEVNKSGYNSVRCVRSNVDHNAAMYISIDSSTAAYFGAQINGTLNRSGSVTLLEAGVLIGNTGYLDTSNYVSKITIDTTRGSFVTNFNQLEGNTNYIVRGYLKTDSGYTYGNQTSFTTNNPFHSVELLEVSSVSGVAATITARVDSHPDFLVIQRGFCWSSISQPTILDSIIYIVGDTGTYESNINLADPLTKYYVRAFVVNSNGIQYSNEISFTSKTEVTVADASGNIYSTVVINGRRWMAENLKTKKYRNGDTITFETDAWPSNNLYYPKMAYYGFNSGYANTFGGLYNHWVVKDSRALCPSNWNVPAIGTWEAMLASVGSTSLEQSIALRDTNVFWHSNDQYPGTNSTGFSARPGGAGFSGFTGVNATGYFWTSTLSIVTFQSYNISTTSTGQNSGLSVRCIQGNP
jgi:uncharacterized protein (TIGR02145 family)